MRQFIIKILAILTIISFAGIMYTEANTTWSQSIKDNMITEISDDNTIIKTAWNSDEKWTSILTGIVKNWVSFTIGLLTIILTWVFIFIWWKLAVSRWEPEEFKKALMWFIYAIIWAVLIPASYAIIKIITWISI